jgi:hypothetical protein
LQLDTLSYSLDTVATLRYYSYGWVNKPNKPLANFNKKQQASQDSGHRIQHVEVWFFCNLSET